MVFPFAIPSLTSSRRQSPSVYSAFIDGDTDCDESMPYDEGMPEQSNPPQSGEPPAFDITQSLQGTSPLPPPSLPPPTHPVISSPPLHSLEVEVPPSSNIVPLPLQLLPPPSGPVQHPLPHQSLGTGLPPSQQHIIPAVRPDHFTERLAFLEGQTALGEGWARCVSAYSAFESSAGFPVSRSFYFITPLTNHVFISTTPPSS